MTVIEQKILLIINITTIQVSTQYRKIIVNLLNDNIYTINSEYELKSVELQLFYICVYFTKLAKI